MYTANGLNSIVHEAHWNLLSCGFIPWEIDPRPVLRPLQAAREAEALHTPLTLNMFPRLQVHPELLPTLSSGTGDTGSEMHRKREEYSRVLRVEAFRIAVVKENGGQDRSKHPALLIVFWLRGGLDGTDDIRKWYDFKSTTQCSELRYLSLTLQIQISAQDMPAVWPYTNYLPFLCFSVLIM